MASARPKCLVILSTKSAGSSAVQALLAGYAGVHHIAATRHRQHETLYWVKAASILGRPQVDMVDSEVPIPPRKAREDLLALLRDNVGAEYAPPADDDATLVFDGWRQLCERFAPVFLEKSPHHLPQAAAVGLLCEAVTRLPEVDFFVVGLVRNPLDTVYSRWRRWRVPPERSEEEWRLAYRNLAAAAEALGPRLLTVRYEDVVTNPAPLAPAFDFIGTPRIAPVTLHDHSVGRWRADRTFGFRLAPSTMMLGEAYGYRPAEMTNVARPFWPVYRIGARWLYRGPRSIAPVRTALRQVKRRLTQGAAAGAP